MEWRADGTSVPREITAGRFARLSPDGNPLLYLLDDRGRGRFRFATLSADGAIGPAQKLWPGDDELDVNWFDLSPDASVLAYAVTQPDGQSNIFLTRFPSGSGRWQVTIDGGTLPRFSRDGRELFYLTGSRDAGGQPLRHFNAVPVTLHPAVKFGYRRSCLTKRRSGQTGRALAGSMSRAMAGSSCRARWIRRRARRDDSSSSRTGLRRWGSERGATETDGPYRILSPLGVGRNGRGASRSRHGAWPRASLNWSSLVA